MKSHICSTLRIKLRYAIMTLAMVATAMIIYKSEKLWAEVKLGSDSPPLVVNEAVAQLSLTMSDLAEKISPTVVSVHSEIVIKQRGQQNPFEELFRNDPFGFFNDRRQMPRSRPEQREFKQEGMGSGVIISKEGYIITNNHVVGEADNIYITLTDQRRFEAEIIGTDKMSDVALIKLKDPPDNLPVVRLGNSDETRVGELVIAIGSPLGYSNTVTQGIISAKGRTTGLNLYENYLQTDAAINPGNSGGALLNLKGELIGINTAIASRSGGSQGIGFAIPINMAKSILKDLLDGGEVKRGFLGVYLQELDDNLAEHFGIKELKGSLVTNVMEDSPASRSGFEQGDLIVKINNEVVKNTNHCRNLVALLKPGQEIDFEILRESKKKTLRVKIGMREANSFTTTPERGHDKKPLLGLKIENIREEHIQTFRLNHERGVIITNVKVNSEADKAGLRAGDVILRVGRMPIKNVDDMVSAIKQSNEKALLLIDRHGQQIFKGIKVK